MHSFLGIDAIEKSKSGHPGVSWAQLRWLMTCLPSKCASIRSVNWINHSRLFCQQGMGLCCSMLYKHHLSGFKRCHDGRNQGCQWGSQNAWASRIWTYCWCRCDNWSTWSKFLYGNWFLHQAERFSSKIQS